MNRRAGAGQGQGDAGRSASWFGGASQSDGSHPETLIDRAIGGGLSESDRVTLDRHLAGCPVCAAELEAARGLRGALARKPFDDVLGRAAVERALNQIDARRRFAAAMRRLLVTLGLAASAGAATAAVVSGLSHRQLPVVAGRAGGVSTSVAPAPFVLSDGSEIAPDDASTRVQIGEQTPIRTTVRLPSGGARFRVRHDGRRLFRVDAGSFEIQDLGTVFRVVHETPNRIRVIVSEGRVAVLCPANRSRVELGAGEDRVFATPGGPSADAASTLENRDDAAMLVAAAARPARGSARPGGPSDPTDLLVAADVARRSRDPQAAVASLRRFVERFPRDPRAPSAAFTLGWVLLTDLAHPREAAVAFIEAERIAPRGALAEDAAARVAEAWKKAGDSRRAVEAARRYERAYPAGQYVGVMRGLIGEH